MIYLQRNVYSYNAFPYTIDDTITKFNTESGESDSNSKSGLLEPK